MHRILVVVFGDEKKVFEAEKGLQQLDREGSICVYCHAILVKQTDDSVKLAQKHNLGPRDSVLSTSIGSLIALLGGPEGLAPSAATGFTFGKGADAYNARLGDDFVDDIRKGLQSGRAALVCEISENWTARLDARMEEIGGEVHRRALSNVSRTKDDDDLAAIEADVDQLRDEQSLSDSNRKANLQEKINKLDSKIRAFGQTAKERGRATHVDFEGLPLEGR